MQPLISVIVATYRQDKLLSRALNSLAEQTYKNFEIILIDDNADKYWNNQTQNIIEAFKQSFPNIKLSCIVNETNLGSAQTRNVGIDASDGDYITFLDDDDLYLPLNLEKQIGRGADLDDPAYITKYHKVMKFGDNDISSWNIHWNG